MEDMTKHAFPFRKSICSVHIDFLFGKQWSFYFSRSQSLCLKIPRITLESLSWSIWAINTCGSKNRASDCGNIQPHVTWCWKLRCKCYLFLLLLAYFCSSLLPPPRLTFLALHRWFLLNHGFQFKSMCLRLLYDGSGCSDELWCSSAWGQALNVPRWGATKTR